MAKDNTFLNSEARESFQLIKTAFLESPILKIFDYALPTVKPDGSGGNIGRILSQQIPKADCNSVFATLTKCSLPSPKGRVYSYMCTFTNDNLNGRIKAEFINPMSNMDEYRDRLPRDATAGYVRRLIEGLNPQKQQIIQKTRTSMKDLDGCESDESGAQPFSSFEVQGYNCCCHALLNMVTCVLFAEHSTISSSYLIASINQCKTITLPPASDNVTSEARQFDLPRQYQSTRGVRRIGFRPIISIFATEFHNRDTKNVVHSSRWGAQRRVFLFFFISKHTPHGVSRPSPTLFFCPTHHGESNVSLHGCPFFPSSQLFWFVVSQKGSVQGRLRGEKKWLGGLGVGFCWVYKTYQVAY